MARGARDIGGRYYAFIESLLHPDTGMVCGDRGECSTTLSRSALAALALIHQGNLDGARRIFEPFEAFREVQGPYFQGFPHGWNSQTGLPDITSIPWEGEAALLLIALEYYREQRQTRREDASLDDLIQGTADWLCGRMVDEMRIVAESIAVMYAALHPIATDPATLAVVDRLRRRFLTHGQISSPDYDHALSHVALGALIFNETERLSLITRFLRSQAWSKDGRTVVSAYSAYAADRSISLEASTQILLALTLSGRTVAAEVLSGELIKVLVRGTNDAGLLGLPKSVAGGTDPTDAVTPALEPTCFLLFGRWRFNPFRPSHSSHKQAHRLSDRT